MAEDDAPKRLTGWELREKLRATNRGQLPPLPGGSSKKETPDSSKKKESKDKVAKSSKANKPSAKTQISKGAKGQSGLLDTLSKYGDAKKVNGSVDPKSGQDRPPERPTLAVHRYTLSVSSLDISTASRQEDDGNMNGSQLSSSAMDERWTRFKLLGRMGLGDIKVSDADKPLIEKSVSILEKSIKTIVATREKEEREDGGEHLHTTAIDLKTGHLLEEVKKLVEIPKEAVQVKTNPDLIDLDEEVLEQITDYVTVISSMYRPSNPFHNFVHATHVLNSVSTLLSQISSPKQNVPKSSQGFGWGVATDPWTHFALVFSALIHDVDHSGVPNAQLIKEKSHVANAYKNKSVAEQNSIELAWNLLMEPCYKELREGIFLTQTELIRFRGLVVTAVMATDIADKELAALRKGRVAEVMELEDNAVSTDVASQKATFVLETIIQASDVSHLMQPFDTYKVWNYNLYQEMYKAFRNGRADTDPTETWWKGEFGFFDYYIIPLAKKLEKCGIDAEKSKVYVENATTNRLRWEKEGEDLVAAYERENKERYPEQPPPPPPPETLTTSKSSSSLCSGLSDASDSTASANGTAADADKSKSNSSSSKATKSPTEKAKEPAKKEKEEKKSKKDKKEKKSKKSAKKEKNDSKPDEQSHDDSDGSTAKSKQAPSVDKETEMAIDDKKVEESTKSEKVKKSDKKEKEEKKTPKKDKKDDDEKKSKKEKKDDKKDKTDEKGDDDDDKKAKKDKKERKRSKSVGAERRRDKDKDQVEEKEKSHRSRSKSRERKKKSEKGGSKSPERKRSKSPRRKEKSRSRSVDNRGRDRDASSSPTRKSKSKSPSRSRSLTRTSSKKDRSKSTERKSRKSKSPTKERRSRSRGRKSTEARSKSPKRSKSASRRKKKEDEAPQ